jgi:hypothetical protein
LSTIKRFFPVIVISLFVWAFGLASNVVPAIGLTSQIEFQQNNENSHFSHFHSVEIEESEFIIIESEPELELELDCFLICPKQADLAVVEVKVNSSSYTSQLFSSKETIPLYDLYCNWKFHLS